MSSERCTRCGVPGVARGPERSTGWKLSDDNYPYCPDCEPIYLDEALGWRRDLAAAIARAEKAEAERDELRKWHGRALEARWSVEETDDESAGAHTREGVPAGPRGSLRDQGDEGVVSKSEGPRWETCPGTRTTFAEVPMGGRFAFWLAEVDGWRQFERTGQFSARWVHQGDRLGKEAPFPATAEVGLLGVADEVDERRAPGGQNRRNATRTREVGGA